MSLVRKCWLQGCGGRVPGSKVLDLDFSRESLGAFEHLPSSTLKPFQDQINHNHWYDIAELRTVYVVIEEMESSGPGQEILPQGEESDAKACVDGYKACWHLF